MRKYVIATTMLAAFASPALAAADGPYVGIEGGATFPQSTDLDVILNHGTTTTDYSSGYNVKYKTGYDVDAILGYKIGPIRLEGEAGYKRAKVKSLGVAPPIITDVGDRKSTRLNSSHNA